MKKFEGTINIHDRLQIVHPHMQVDIIPESDRSKIEYICRTKKRQTNLTCIMMRDIFVSRFYFTEIASTNSKNRIQKSHIDAHQPHPTWFCDNKKIDVWILMCRKKTQWIAHCYHPKSRKPRHHLRVGLSFLEQLLFMIIRRCFCTYMIQEILLVFVTKWHNKSLLLLFKKQKEKDRSLTCPFWPSQTRHP